MFARGVQIKAGREVSVVRHFPRISRITRSFCRCDTAFSYAEEVLNNFLFFQKYYFSMLSKSSAMLLISRDSLGTSLIPILVRHNLLDYAVFN